MIGIVNMCLVVVGAERGGFFVAGEGEKSEWESISSGGFERVF